MAKKEKSEGKNSNMIGRTAFLVGLLLAIVAGAFNVLDGMWSWVLALIGILIGILNVTEKETQPFLMSGVVLIIASAFGLGALSSVPELARVLIALLMIFVPATIIVAVRNVYNIAKD